MNFDGYTSRIRSYIKIRWMDRKLIWVGKSNFRCMIVESGEKKPFVLIFEVR